MPYIMQEDRDKLDLGAADPTTPGELNYLVTMMALRYLGRRPNYQRFNDVIGALEAAKLELYRRMVAPYEDEKIKANGDVYP